MTGKKTSISSNGVSTSKKLVFNLNYLFLIKSFYFSSQRIHVIQATLDLAIYQIKFIENL